MSDINLDNFKKFVNQNNTNDVVKFLEEISSIFKISFSNLNITDLDTKILIQEVIGLINKINTISNSEKEIIKHLKQLLLTNNLQIEDLLNTLYTIIINLDKNTLSNNLISYNWQLSIKERESSNNGNKLEKVEIAMQLNSYDNKSSNYKQDLIKMNYYEFTEIFQNLKKIDSQLHIFKN